MQRCFDVVSMSGTGVVSTLCNVENTTSDFVSFSTSDQRYFNVDPTLKCLLGKMQLPQNSEKNTLRSLFVRKF